MRVFSAANRFGALALSLALLAGCASIYAGFWFLMLLPAKEPTGCWAFTLYYTTGEEGNGCWDIWPLAVMAWVDSLLWFAVGISITIFLTTGRYQKWEDHWDNNKTCAPTHSTRPASPSLARSAHQQDLVQIQQL